MNVMTRILNALAFANAGNQREFNNMLRQVNLPSASLQDPLQRSAFAAQFDTSSSSASGIRHAHGAL